jgi:hypothetical protein
VLAEYHEHRLDAAPGRLRQQQPALLSLESPWLTSNAPA